MAELSRLVGERFFNDATLGRQVAVAHTLFNLINLLLFIAFTVPLARLASLVAPDRPKKTTVAGKPLYLDPIYLETPNMAIDRAHLECCRLATLAVSMAEDIPHAAIEGELRDLRKLDTRDDELDDLQTAILNYLSCIQAAKLAQKDQHAINQIIALVNSWENIGDLLDSHVLPLGHDRLETGHAISDKTKKTLFDLHQALLQDLRLALLVTTKSDPQDMQSLLRSKATFRKLADDAESDLRSSLVGRDPERMELFRLESDLISNFKHIHHHCRRPAKLLAEG
ncbi:hypothetical protein [Pelagicoccus sp. SDUM812002]|uniref:hypothetical protein n=1 Tax=Pelagicoccus sp. SDUM812002 TaxID=3041266 RepID=UPI00280E4C3A|nr:hypothetical protein [Pelagicoccus sp. SDUM812002]MDQ8184019.1 hypothetical protein [Pelagicoccus sp. SDUM812002]